MKALFGKAFLVAALLVGIAASRESIVSAAAPCDIPEGQTQCVTTEACRAEYPEAPDHTACRPVMDNPCQCQLLY